MPTEHRIIRISLTVELISHKSVIALENHFKVRFDFTSKELLSGHDDLMKLRANCKFTERFITI